MNITKCVNYECKYFKEEKESRCRVLAFPILCECHNDDPDSENVNEYKRKLTNLYLKRRKRKNAKYRDLKSGVIWQKGDRVKVCNRWQRMPSSWFGRIHDTEKMFPVRRKIEKTEK